MVVQQAQSGMEAAAGSDATALAWEGAPGECQNQGPAFHARSYLIDWAMRAIRPKTLLDIGCGRGYVTAIAARHARRVVAVDMAHEAAAATRALLVDHPDASLIIADVFGGGLANCWAGRFDAVLLSEVLEHLPDDVGALATCRELLSEGGSLVLTVPGDPSLWTRWDDLAGHQRRYTRSELMGKLETAGFHVRKLINWGFPLTGWLAARGARMRARRVDERHPDGEVPAGIRRLLPAASLVFRLAARIEPKLSFLDRGAGYLVIAEPADAPAGSADRSLA